MRQLHLDDILHLTRLQQISVSNPPALLHPFTSHPSQEALYSLSYSGSKS